MTAQPPKLMQPDEYVPNEIIVKFREKAAHKVEKQLKLKTSAGRLTVSRNLDELNAAFGITNIRPIFRNFKQNRQRLQALRKKNKNLLNKKEKHILNRLQRAPKGLNVPDLSGIYKIKFKLKKGQSIKQALRAYNKNPNIEYAELNYRVSINNTPDDPCYPFQWSLNNTGQMYPESGYYNHPPGTPDCDIDAPEAWDIYTGSSQVIIAVIDTGLDYTHRDLDDNIWANGVELNGTPGLDDDGNGYVDDIYGYDFINDDSDPSDDNGHGTHCSGIIAAEGNNGRDIAGICWDARIMALKFLDYDGGGWSDDAIEAFYYAVENGADITSNSWGGAGYTLTMQEAINYAYSQGVVMVAAAGNDYSSNPQYPAYYQHVISVAATNSNDEKPSFSNFGDWVDIAAPGVDVLSLRANGTSLGTPYDAYTTIASGTSMACPHVAGACALLMSIYPEATIDELEQTLMATADPIAPYICASGRLNLFQASLQIIKPQGRIILDRQVYPCSANIEIELFDSDLKGLATQQVTIGTDGGDFETVSLTQIVPALGVFEATIATASADPCLEDGTLQTAHDQTITVTYYDANDGTENPATVTETATVDCESPEIFDVNITLPGREPWVRFQTNEPTTARVHFGLACGGPYTIKRTASTFATQHTVKLPELSPETQYFFIIDANDVAGNGTIDTNDSTCYSFTTISADGQIHVPSQSPTIQEAIDNCWDGMTVCVADGTYTGFGNRDLDFHGKAITVTSENGPENCIIDCNGSETESHRGFNFHSGEEANSILSGFTITNGYVAGSWDVGIGGAINIFDSNPTIKNSIFTENTAAWDGGAINIYVSSPTIINCTFSRNSAIGNDGGAINNELISSPTITNCSFIANSAFDWGGAIRNLSGCNPTITNCTFIANSGDDGGAMFYFFRCRPTITNATFAANSGRNGNALACDSWFAQHRSNIRITNSIFADGGDEIRNFDNSPITITYSNIQDGYPGEGNINTDPCFVEPGRWDSNGLWLDGDYRLLTDSPCIDAADNTSVPADITDLDGDGNTAELVPCDLDGDRRFLEHPVIPDTGYGSPPVVDMGAYEFAYRLEVPMTFTPQKLNCDNKRGRWVRARFVLPEGFSPEDVDLTVPAVAEIMDTKIQSVQMNIFVKKHGLVEIVAVFNRSDFCSAAALYGPLDITVSGFFTAGYYFAGTDTINVKNKNLEYLAVLASHWLDDDCSPPDWCAGLDIDRSSKVDFTDYAKSTSTLK
ncbi:MAG: S8 family serine peptidase [Planctomycetota bacterium]